MPFSTELAAANVELMIDGANERLASALSRDAKTTSEGELTLVGTRGVENVGAPLVREPSESEGKTR
jgi:hypothetical protein